MRCRNCGRDAFIYYKKCCSFKCAAEVERNHNFSIVGTIILALLMAAYYFFGGS